MASHKADPAAAQRAAAEVEVAAEALVGIWAHVAESLDVRVSPTQLRALTAVGRYDELNLSQLAEALGALPSSASRLCDRLEAAGLLLRDTGRASRRAVSLRLTPEGEALLEQARTRRQELIAQVLDGMSPSGRDNLAQGLAAFQSAAEPQGLPEASSDGASAHGSSSADGGSHSARGPGGIPFSISA
jgi:DNA-binding MarR family transcriptional regulator